MYICIYIYIYGTPPKTHLFMSFKYTFYEFQIYWWDKWGLPFALHTYIYPHIYIYRPYLSCQLRKIKAQNQKNKNKKTQTLRRMFGFDSKDCFFWCSLSFFRFFFWVLKVKKQKTLVFFHKCTIN